MAYTGVKKHYTKSSIVCLHQIPPLRGQGATEVKTESMSKGMKDTKKTNPSKSK